MSSLRTPPRDDPDPTTEAPPDDAPLSSRMTRLEHELWAIDGLLGKVTKGKPKATAPASVAEAFELTDPAQAAKAKDTVSGRPPPRPSPNIARAFRSRCARPRPRPQRWGQHRMQCTRGCPTPTLPADGDDSENGARSLFAFFHAPIVGGRRVSCSNGTRLDVAAALIPASSIVRHAQNKKKGNQGEDKVKEKEMPAWWRLNEVRRDKHASRWRIAIQHLFGCPA